MSLLKLFSKSSSGGEKGLKQQAGCVDDAWVDEELAKMAEEDAEMAGNWRRIGKNRMSVSRSGRFKSKHSDRKIISEENFDNTNTVRPATCAISQPTSALQAPPLSTTRSPTNAGHSPLQLTPTRKELQKPANRKLNLGSSGQFYHTSC